MFRLRNCYRLAGVVFAAGLLLAHPARGENETLPTFRASAGAFLIGKDHDFFVDSEVKLPLLQEDPIAFYYRHREATPFLDLDKGVQAELLYQREEGQVDFKLNSHLRLFAVIGYQTVHAEDRTGLFSAYTFGAGIGSPVRVDGERLHWSVVVGSYMDRRDVSADWWADVSGSWRVVDFAEDKYMGSDYRASVVLSADVQSVNDGDRFGALYIVGPEIQFNTANNNRANLQLRWYHNDNNPFYGSDEDGLLLGLDINSSHDDSYVLHALERRESGWFPMIWGDYDIGFGGDRRTQRFSMNVEVVDFTIADQRFTNFIWYESHQDHRVGDFDNISYTVTLGLQSTVGLESPLSQDQPLVAGLDFLHRSDHALNPDNDRVQAVGEPTAVGKLIPNGSINILPRLRLQTLGWDLPYRDPSMYERKTEWINNFDWRATVGMTGNSNRPRGNFSGQLGLNWDIATVQGYVVYAHGVGSIGDESPDWQGELGVRRPSIKVFTRYEDYGISRTISRGSIVVLGMGVYL